MNNSEERRVPPPRRRSSQYAEPKVRAKSESFHTLPQEHLISRKDIIRRTCSKSEDPITRLTQSLRKKLRRSKPENEEDKEERPRTLPSVCRRASAKDREAPTMTLVPMTRISRQEIIRRTSSAATDDQRERTLRRKSCGNLYSVAQMNMTDSRHAGCFVKNVAVSTNPRSRVSDRWRAVDVERTIQVPRPSTLPKIAKNQRRDPPPDAKLPTTKDPMNKQEAPIYGRIRRRKISMPNGDSNSIGEATLSRARKTYRSIRDPASDPPNYGMLDYRSNASLPNLPQRTMSRRRIIDNAEEARGTLPSTKPRRRSSSVQKEGHWYEPPPVAPPRRASMRVAATDESMMTGSSKSLPSYVKRTRKASCIPLRVDRPRDDFASKSLSRVTNGPRRLPASEQQPHSILGLCTNRRRAIQQPTEETAMNPYRIRGPRMVRLSGGTLN